MQSTTSFFRRPGGVLAGAALLLAGGFPLAVSAAEDADAFPTFESYIKIAGQTPWVSGNKAAYQNRTRSSGDGSAGIEDLHYYKDVSRTSYYEIDGHALTGANDYLAQFKFLKTEVGSLEAGYKRFRTFYDGAGGFFPLNNAWLPLANQDLHTDRATYWIEAKVNLPDRPVYTVRYENLLRNGMKDSLHWGDSDFTGLPNNNLPVSQVRKIIPSWRQLGERHQTLDASIAHKIGKTSFILKAEGEKTHNLDTRNVTRFPGEVKPFPAPANTVLVPAASMNNQVILAQTDGMDTTSAKVVGTTETTFSPKIKVRTALSYELENTDFVGDRPLITSTPTAAGVVLVTTNNYQGLAGGSRIKVVAGNVVLDTKPLPNFAVRLSLRGEDKYTTGTGTFNVVAATGTPAVTLATTPRLEYGRVKEHSLTPDLDLRYTGISNLALYGSGNWRHLKGDERNSSAYNPVTAAAGTIATNTIGEIHGNYNVGASWHKYEGLTLRGDISYKDHEYSSIAYGLHLGDRYVRNMQTTTVKLTAITRLNEQWSFTTRTIHQQGAAQVEGYLPDKPAFDSMTSRSYTIDETVDWNPTKQFYAQLNANAVYAYISTIYPRAGITPATATNIAFNSNDVLQNSNSNYINGSVLAGMVLTKKDDVQVQYTYYHATNGNTQVAYISLPYGVAALDSTVTVGLKHKLSDNLILNAKAGYTSSRNDTTGGNTNYHAPMAYVSLAYGL